MQWSRLQRTAACQKEDFFPPERGLFRWCQDKKRVLVENDLSGRHSKAENGGTLVEQAQIYSGALVQLGKMTCGGIGVAVSLPAAAAGEIAALIFDKAHHIGERITKKHADLMGKIGFAAQPPGQLLQHTVTIGSIFRQA